MTSPMDTATGLVKTGPLVNEPTPPQINSVRFKEILVDNKGHGQGEGGEHHLHKLITYYINGPAGGAAEFKIGGKKFQLHFHMRTNCEGACKQHVKNIDDEKRQDVTNSNIFTGILTQAYSKYKEYLWSGNSPHSLGVCGDKTCIAAAKDELKTDSGVAKGWEHASGSDDKILLKKTFKDDESVAQWTFTFEVQFDFGIGFAITGRKAVDTQIKCDFPACNTFSALDVSNIENDRKKAARKFWFQRTVMKDMVKEAATDGDILHWKNIRIVRDGDEVVYTRTMTKKFIADSEQSIVYYVIFEYPYRSYKPKIAVTSGTFIGEKNDFALIEPVTKTLKKNILKAAELFFKKYKLKKALDRGYIDGIFTTQKDVEMDKLTLEGDMTGTDGQNVPFKPVLKIDWSTGWDKPTLSLSGENVDAENDFKANEDLDKAILSKRKKFIADQLTKVKIDVNKKEKWDPPVCVNQGNSKNVKMSYKANANIELLFNYDYGHFMQNGKRIEPRVYMRSVVPDETIYEDLHSKCSDLRYPKKGTNEKSKECQPWTAHEEYANYYDFVYGVDTKYEKQNVAIYQSDYMPNDIVLLDVYLLLILFVLGLVCCSGIGFIGGAILHYIVDKKKEPTNNM
eukprot:441037_1